MIDALDAVGNPSSIHAEGRAARGRIEAARDAVARLSGASARDVVFTSGGTEAANAAVYGAIARAVERGTRPHVVLGAIEHAIATESLSGPMNVAAPHALRQRDFAKVLGRVVRRPSFAPAPAAALKLALGAELAHELLLASAHVIPDALTSTGYEFRYPNAEGALRHLLGRGDTVNPNPALPAPAGELAESR